MGLRAGWRGRPWRWGRWGWNEVARRAAGGSAERDLFVFSDDLRARAGGRAGGGRIVAAARAYGVWPAGLERRDYVITQLSLPSLPTGTQGQWRAERPLRRAAALRHGRTAAKQARARGRGGVGCGRCSGLVRRREPAHVRPRRGSPPPQPPRGPEPPRAGGRRAGRCLGCPPLQAGVPRRRLDSGRAAARPVPGRRLALRAPCRRGAAADGAAVLDSDEARQP